MGVDYSAGFGYGIKLTERDIPAEFEERYVGAYAEAVCKEIQKSEYDGRPVKYILVGDGMGIGEEYAIVGFVKSISTYEPALIEFEMPTQLEQDALRMFALERGWPEPAIYGGLYVS